MVLLALVCALLVACGTQEAGAQYAGDGVQRLRVRPRARTRITVVPAYPYRLFSTPYPVPYKYEYPGPGAVRECAAALVPENRPSGPVIVPRMHCWWQ
jgi:hypothetical protein